MNMFQIPKNNINNMGINLMQNQMNMVNKMMMCNMMMNNNPMLMNNMKNNPIQIPMNNMMGNNMIMNNNLMQMKNVMNNNLMGMNNMMNMNMPMNFMMNNNIIGNNNMMNMPNMMNNNPMQINNMMNMAMNPLQMNNMMNMPMNSLMNIPMNFPNNINNNNINMNFQNKINSAEIKVPKKKRNKERKTPSILLRNANRKIESITFQVEKGLKPSKNLLVSNNIKIILNKLFSKRKKIINKRGQTEFTRENEPMEILNYKFDTNEKEFFNTGKQSLIQGLILAYKNHFPITVSPDMIWILILQGYSRFMDKFPELVREKYVNFEGQKTLFINRYGLPVNKATEKDWDGIIDECVEQIGEYTGEEIISNLQSDFTTTNAATLLASQASIMSAMKHYFKYEVAMGGCGISYINLEGTLEDWKKIKSKLEFLSNFGLKWWTKHLIQIIENIIKTKKFYDKNKKIDSELVNFWKTMIRIKDKNDEYEPDIINGWIIKFIPDLSENIPKLFDEIFARDVEDEIISCPLKIIEDMSNGLKTIYNCDIASGFFGMTQDKKTLSVKPVIGYTIVVDEKETSPMTSEDKERIIKNYFS